MTVPSDIPVYVYTVTVPGFLPPTAVGTTTPSNWAFDVKGSYLEVRGDTYVISASDGAVVCVVPLGSVIVRADAQG